MCHPKGYTWFLGHFGLKTGIDFAQFGLESDFVFEETKGVYKRHLSFKFQINQKEIVICWIRNGFLRSLFDWAYKLKSKNDDFISTYTRSEKGCGKYQCFCVKWGQDLEKRETYPHQEFLGITPPLPPNPWDWKLSPPSLNEADGIFTL